LIDWFIPRPERYATLETALSVAWLGPFMLAIERFVAGRV
jgi:hypothetical protein